MGVQYGNFPYTYPVDTARKKCKERYISFRFLSKVPKIVFPNKDMYTLCYAYFRWFDDIVDSIKLSSDNKNFVVQRQKEFIPQLYSKEIPEELATEELFLAHLVNFDKQNGKNIRKDLEKLIGALEFDANRKNKILSASEMEQYTEDNIVPYVNISLAIFNLDKVPKEEFYKLARAGLVVDYISDMREDIKSGYINIPKQDISRFNINLDDLDSPEMQRWVKSKTDPLEDILSEKEQLSPLPFLANVVTKVMVRKRRGKLQKIINNNYTLPN